MLYSWLAFWLWLAVLLLLVYCRHHFFDLFFFFCFVVNFTSFFHIWLLCTFLFLPCCCWFVVVVVVVFYDYFFATCKRKSPGIVAVCMLFFEIFYFLFRKRVLYHVKHEDIFTEFFKIEQKVEEFQRELSFLAQGEKNENDLSLSFVILLEDK